MNHVWAPCLDWRAQFSALMPYFQRPGGLVHVHAGPASPISAFARAVRNRLQAEEWQHRWSTVQIHPDNANTHYVTGIMSQIRKSVGLNVTETDLPPVNLSLGNENRVRRDMSIHDVDIAFTYGQDGNLAQVWARAAHLCESLKSVLETQHIALILVDTHKWDTNKLTDFIRILWEDALENLINQGLLVIDIFDPEVLRDKVYAWPPDPHRILPLPDHYDEQSRADAFSDLISIAMSEGWHLTSEEASVFASTILDTSENIRDVYALLARKRARPAPDADA